MSELADQVTETEVSGAETPVGDAAGSSGAARPTAAPETPEKPLSLREQLNKSVESIRTEEAKRARAADGKFTKLEEGAAKEPATPKSDPKPEANAQPAASKPAGPPSGWSKESKALWDTLPEALKADAVRREAEVAKGFEEYRTKTAQLTEISQALDPIRPVLQQNGIQSDAQAVKRLLEWESSFRNPQTRVAAFHQLAKQYGVDLSTLVPSSPGTPSAAQDIPEPLRNQFGQIQQTVQDVSSRVQSWEQQQTDRELKAFANDHPHFEAVRVTMGQLMQAGMAPDLESAYQKAIALNPEISAQLRAEEDRKKADELARANAEKVRSATRAAVSPTPRPPSGGSGGQSAPKRGVRDSILASVQQLREEQRA